MFKALTASPATAVIVLALGIIGCATAGLITGHLISADFMSVLVLVGSGGGVAAGAHIGGTVANTATPTSDVSVPAAAGPATAGPVQGPGPTQAAPPAVAASAPVATAGAAPIPMAG